MSEDKWWGKPEEKESSKETIEEMMNHTEMMKIKREEEMAQAQHEAELRKMKNESIGTKSIDSAPAPPAVQAKGVFHWLTDDPGYFFIAIFIVLGIIGSLVASALTPSIDETWGKTDGIVLEGTEWWEYEIEHEDCVYDEFYDTYDCYYTYSYDCGADVYYNYSVDGVVYFDVYYDLFLGNWNDYCLEIVEDITLPLNSSLEVWYKLDDNEISQLESPNDAGVFFSGIALCCLLPILIVLLIFMYFDGNNDEYENSDSNNGNETHHHHHYHHGGGIFGGVYYGSPWYRRPWFHRRRSRRIIRRTSRSSRSSSGGGRRSGGGGRRSGGGGRRSGGGGRRSGGGGRRSR